MVVERNVTISDKDQEVQASTLLLGEQEQVISAHWNVSTKEVSKQLAQQKTERQLKGELSKKILAGHTNNFAVFQWCFTAWD